MRRRHHILPIAFAATLFGGCLGSFGTPGGSPDPTSQDPAPTDTSGGNGVQTGGTGNGTGAGNGSGTGSGDGMGSGDTTPTMPPAQTGAVALTLDKATDTIRLNETKTFTITLTPSGGFAGGVSLALDNAPAGVTGKFTPASVNVMGTAPVTATISLTVASNMATPAASIPLSIKATSGTISSAVNLGATIPAELLVEIPNGVQLGTAAAQNKAAFGTFALPVIQVAAGTKVTWINRDGINHEIHSDGSFGIAHESGDLLANGGNTYSQVFKNTGAAGTTATYSYRCHKHPNMIGSIVVTNQ